ncbi:MATE family efflux transporter [Gynuella sp.]|uniref:MATE family efflux transporter n=1 Tax=Gynuella sp. TaxID=2969146 RepID=UPI003D0E2306
MQLKTSGVTAESETDEHPPAKPAPQKTLLTLAGKMIIVQLAPLIASLIVARLIATAGGLEFSAYSLVNSINLTVFIVISGILQAIYVLGGDAIGKNDPAYYHHVISAGLKMAIVAAIVATIFSALIGPVLKGLNYDVAFARYSHFFALASCLGIIPTILLVAFRIHASLNQRAGIASAIYMIGALFTIVVSLAFSSRFDSALWITLFIITVVAASQWLMLVLALASLYVFPELRLSGQASSKDVKRRTLSILYAIGWPIGVVVFLDAFAPLFSSLFVGRLAIDAMPVHSVVSLWAVVVSIIPLGLSQSVVQHISVLNAQAQFAARNQIALLAMLLTAGYGVVVYLVFLLWPVEIGQLLLGVSDEDSQRLLAELMPLGGIFLAFQSVIIMAAAILRGIGQTKAPMFQAIVGYLFIASGMQVLLGYVLKLGVQGIWWGMITGYVVTAIIISLRCMRELKPTRNTTNF